MLQDFKIAVPNEVLEDLRFRLTSARWPDQLPGSGWNYGADLSYLRGLVDYWIDGYDWRKQEAALNSLPQFVTEVEGVPLHFVHVRSARPGALPLLLSHGWPGNFYEMHKIVGPLTSPATEEDAFDVIVPSLPGFGFSGPTVRGGVSPRVIAALMHRLMTDELGYTRYGAQGGDFGSSVSTWLGRLHPESVIGIHLNMVGAGDVSEPRNDEERELAAHRAWWQQNETGYSSIQRTKPQTVAYGLNDSPIGLAAWIVEKWRTWSDCDGDIESVFSKDEILTNIMIYWVNQTIGSSMRLYYESARDTEAAAMASMPVTVPTGVANFPKEIIRSTRELAGRAYNLVHWTDMPRGGHFAAMEQPELLVDDVRQFFRALR